MGFPKRNAWLARIHNELGGWSGILERRAGGATWTIIAKDVGCSRSFLGLMIRAGAKKSEKFAEAVELANKEYAEHLAEESLDIVDAPMQTREELERAKLRATHRRWLASVYDREKFGEPKDKSVAPVSIGELHIQALIQAPQHRTIPARVDAPASLPSGPSSPVEGQLAEPVSEE